MNINIMFLHVQSWWVVIFFPQSFFVSSKWTQRNRFLINFITSHWTTLLVRIQLHSSSTPNWVLWVHILLWKVCNNSSQATKPFLLWALVVNYAILAQHTNELFCPTNPNFVIKVVGQMWTWQDGMDGSMSCSQMEVGHHLNPKFFFNNPNF